LPEHFEEIKNKIDEAELWALIRMIGNLKPT
jgi:hypothetical protein